MSKKLNSPAVMARRKEPRVSLDHFPTPLWATRALIEDVYKPLGFICSLGGIDWPFFHGHVAEPACGLGCMAEALNEYTLSKPVIASDIYDYGYGDVCNFLSSDWNDSENVKGKTITHIITNPPFKLAIEFTLKALSVIPKDGTVAMMERIQWNEGNERYKRLFEPHPPHVIASFCERVPMVAGRLDEKVSSATNYAWFIWAGNKKATQTRFIWIPPGAKERHNKQSDWQRFDQDIAPMTAEQLGMKV